MFFTSAPCSCVSLRDFVKVIVGAFFYFFNKNELEKKSTASLEKVTGQVCDSRSELSSASREPVWPSFGQTLKMFIKKKTKTERENTGEVLNSNRVRAIRAFCAKG